MKHVYFNRWFSVSYHYRNMIRDNPDGKPFRFYTTHPDLNHFSLVGSDHAEQEPVLHGTEYVDYAVDFCRRNEIDIFVPRLKMLDIAREIARFDEIGTKVMVCRDIALLENLMEKDRFYAALRDTGVVEIPQYYVAENAQQFRLAYESLLADGLRVCFKPTDSEGGMGFRIINNNRNALQELYGYVTLSIGYEQALQTLSSVEAFPRLMVMELLEGDEISIDCVADAGGGLIVAIPRRKGAGRIYTIDNAQELQEIAARVAAHCRIPFAFNIQVKYNKGIPKLLEINPRMSGGLYITGLTGVNMPYLAVKALLGEPVEPPSPRYGLKISYIEQPILMGE